MGSLKGISEGSLEFLKQKIKVIRDYKYNKFYPNNPRHDDTYIVEFPKSGITWLSTLIANINLLESNENAYATFYNIHQYIPDIHTSKDLHYKPLWNFPKYRFIKSHDIYNKNYNFVIYLIRDPYRVMNSYYLFTQQLGIFNGTFDEFVKNPNYGIEKWINHVESWLNRDISSQRIHLIKYEDLINNTLDIMKNLYDDLGIKVSLTNINKAIELSNINNMKISEEKHCLNNPHYYDLSFIGQGKGLYAINMNDDVKQYITKKIKNSSFLSKIYTNGEK